MAVFLFQEILHYQLLSSYQLRNLPLRVKEVDNANFTRHQYPEAKYLARINSAYREGEEEGMILKS